MPKNRQCLFNRHTKISKNLILHHQQHDRIHQYQHNIDDQNGLGKGAKVVVVGEGEGRVNCVGDGEDGLEGAQQGGDVVLLQPRGDS
jgi:hypothetical protein